MKVHTTTQKDLFALCDAGKSCMTILTMVKYEWFEEWKDTAVRKRGDEYYNYKMRFAKNLFAWACTVFPKIKGKVGQTTVCRRMHNIKICHGRSRPEHLYRFIFSWFTRKWRLHSLTGTIWVPSAEPCTPLSTI